VTATINMLHRIRVPTTASDRSDYLDACGKMVGNERSGAMIDMNGQQVPDDLAAEWGSALWSASLGRGPIPYIVCPECGGLKCAHCCQRGWLASLEAELDAPLRGPIPAPIAEVRARFRASHEPILSAESAQPIGWKAKRIDPRTTLRDVGAAAETREGARPSKHDALRAFVERWRAANPSAGVHWRGHGRGMWVPPGNDLPTYECETALGVFGPVEREVRHDLAALCAEEERARYPVVTGVYDDMPLVHGRIDWGPSWEDPDEEHLRTQREYAALVAHHHRRSRIAAEHLAIGAHVFPACACHLHGTACPAMARGAGEPLSAYRRRLRKGRFPR